jgi:leucine dehydrogenase
MKHIVPNNTFLSSLPEFDTHECVSILSDAQTGLSAVIAIHRIHPGVPSFGATRFWHYASPTEGIRDALRLGRLMSYKSALAGLPCGGAKGVIIASRDPHTITGATRKRLLQAYAKGVNVLGGNFITGTDVGVSQKDIAVMRDVSDSIVGFNDNSTECTALGVFESVRVSVAEVFGSPDLSGHSFAIQGLGKVGGGLLAHLYDRVGEKGTIYVSDTNSSVVTLVKKKYPRVQVVSSENIALQDAEVFCPCALSGAIHEKNIQRLRAKIVVGGANNQLASEALGDLLHQRHILYAPDYVVNAGGLIAVFDEYQHTTYSRTRVEKLVHHIPDTLQKIFTESRRKNLSPHTVAQAMAQKICNGYKK